MVILITGATHTGKTLLAQKLLEKYKYPYLSIDLLKMGLIRSKNTPLKAEEDAKLQEYLWPIVREIVKTAIENRQNLIVEGGYISPFWKEDFTQTELNSIRYICLVMKSSYIEKNFKKIKEYANAIEQRKDDSWCTKEFVLKENAHYFEMCKKYGHQAVLIDEDYDISLDLS